ncbi:MAG: DNA/RNA nuclease SfsA [Lachnospiraceae bacterium]|nr:DNA/RNA nuclease SfsA [Lachnospiraceae bacterium]
MKYNNIIEATFLERPNRFIAYAKLGDEVVTCHVKNTGRCKELLIPGKSKVFLEDHGEGTARKTRYSLVKVQKGERLINMDSQAPNQIVQEWMEQGGLYPDITFIKRECKYGNSRFDIYYERSNGVKGFVEVKGVTLEEDDVARFPDAPTERGVKHIYELIEARKDGYETNIVFVIQMTGIHHFEPNIKTHKAFGDALCDAAKAGVNIVAIDCIVTKEEVWAKDFVDVRLN